MAKSNGKIVRRVTRRKSMKGNVASLINWRKQNQLSETSESTNPKNTPNNTSETGEVLITVTENSSTTVENIVPSSRQERNQNVNELLITSEKGSILGGNRIVDILYLLKQLKEICNHDKILECSFNNLILTNEVRNGLASKFFLKCTMCNKVFSFHSMEPLADININEAAVSAILGIGSGYYNLEEFLACVDIPCMTSKTYQKYHQLVANRWQNTANDVMKKAAQEEADHSKNIGYVDEKGYPLVPVVVDGCWSKRSYGTNYNALSGAAAIVGQYTGKVLFLGVRNKYCVICARNKTEQVESHACTKNHSGSSTSMESDIILQGFKSSVEMYGIKYNILIGDGDSNTYKKIIEARPYTNVSVEKIECTNHLLRNFCKKLKVLVSDKSFTLQDRKLLECNIFRLRTGIVKAVKHHKENADKNTAAKCLRGDILNGIYHVLGQHENCATYFCQRPVERNFISEISQTFLERITFITRYTANHSRSLLMNMSSNIVEQYNSIVAKFVGGKRINYSLGNSYQTRCAAAVVSHNTKMAHSIYRKNKVSMIKKIETKRIKKVCRQRQFRKQCSRLTIKKQTPAGGTDESYGENAQQTDMPNEMYLEEEKEFLSKLIKTESEIHEMERRTVNQSQDGEWMEQRRKLLTASNFGKVCKIRKTTNTAGTVKSILYNAFILSKVPSLNHGKLHEIDAKLELEMKINKKIHSSGLFVHKEVYFLGASPDGIIEENNWLVEIKCPYTAYKQKYSPDEAISKKAITFWKQKNGQLEINKNHDWYFQIQGQLEIADREICLLCIWTGRNNLKIEQIKRDRDFWTTKMEKKLIHFYKKCLLPEIIDPRASRNMPIRDVKLDL